MATTHQGVNAIATIPASVETALRQTMVLGLPAVEAERPTFYFKREVTWANHDVEGQPWDWTTAPDTDVTRPAVQPICAYEFFSPLGRSGAQHVEVGDFYPSTVVLTMTETDFPSVVDSSYVTIGPAQSRWWFRYYRPALGLGGLSVYQVHMAAEDTE